MSVGSFSTSLSGLNANQQELSVIGNNLANINTVAYKASAVQFADLVSQTVSGTGFDPMQVGLGVTLGQISPNFVQGGINNTGVATNVAIQGNGFFVVGSGNDQSFSRAGNFSLNAQGQLITADGLPVQGYTQVDPATGSIITTGALSDLVVPPGLLRAPAATTSFQTATNLDASQPVGGTFASSVQIFDKLGVSHVATINYTKTAAGTWGYNVTVPGEDLTGGTPGVPSSIAVGTVKFDGTGQLTQVNGGAPAAVTITSPAWADGAGAANMTWNVIDQSGAGTLTGFSNASATSSITQNGSPTGTVDSVSIDSQGEIVASFGAGRTVTVGQIALANFNNPQGLVNVGTNRFGQSEASGIVNVGTAGTGGRGTLIGSALEQSNVDIATEFTNMILAQRGYQANSKSITVADELLQNTIDLKR
jgi:flagellar hook protein FlgE